MLGVPAIPNWHGETFISTCHNSSFFEAFQLRAETSFTDDRLTARITPAVLIDGVCLTEMVWLLPNGQPSYYMSLFFS